MNPAIARLKPYPFNRLRHLLGPYQPAPERSLIDLAVGEPQHPPPPLIEQALSDAFDSLHRYPPTQGSEALRAAIAAWLVRRFALRSLDPATQVLPVNGTREALFAIAQCMIDPGADATVVLPNPFYQIYAGAALYAGATPVYLDCREGNGFLPELDSVPAAVWQRCQLLYLCNPGNPTGAVMDETWLQRCIALADEYDFIIAADECYSEIYFDEVKPPPGILGAAARLGRHDYRRCLSFNSLSKRSNAAGLRSGLVAGDADILATFLHYRTYHGCAMPLHHQAASAAAWQDETHVITNRTAYRAKRDAVLDILAPVMPTPMPSAGFFLWPQTPEDDEMFAVKLYRQAGIRSLPGRYLAEPTATGDPGRNRLRLALVAPLATCIEAAERIRQLYQ